MDPVLVGPELLAGFAGRTPYHCGVPKCRIIANTHCVYAPHKNWIRERVRGVSDHQERPKAFPMAHMQG